MAQATVSDVRGVIDTRLSDPDIKGYISDAEYEAKNAIDDYTNTLDPSDRSQLEKYLTALRIRELADRPASSTSRETVNISYQGNPLAALRREVEKRDPSNSLAHQTDNSRYVNIA